MGLFSKSPEVKAAEKARDAYHHATSDRRRDGDKAAQKTLARLEQRVENAKRK